MNPGQYAVWSDERAALTNASVVLDSRPATGGLLESPCAPRKERSSQAWGKKAVGLRHARKSELPFAPRSRF